MCGPATILLLLLHWSENGELEIAFRNSAALARPLLGALFFAVPNYTPGLYIVSMAFCVPQKAASAMSRRTKEKRTEKVNPLSS